jgi:Bacterial SH3 domain
MKYRRKNLLNLLQASQRLLENPEDEEEWRAFQKALKTVEDAEKAEALAEQPENLRNPDTRKLLRRYYEEDFKLRNRILLRVSSLAALLILVSFLVFILSRGGGPLALLTFNLPGRSTPTATYTPSATLTLSPTVTSTFTASPSPTLTATFTPTSTPTASPSPTSTETPTSTASLTSTLTATSTPSPTIIPLLNTELINGNLTNDGPAQRYIFRGQSGDVITVRLDSDDFDPYLSVQTSSEEEIASNDDCGSLRRACIGPIRLPENDIYVIVVDSYTRRETGAFTLDITLISRADCNAELPRVIIISLESAVNLRSGPAQSYAIVGQIYSGECFALIGRNQNGTWLQIRTPSGRRGWILANLTQLQGNLDDVPMVDE